MSLASFPFLAPHLAVLPVPCLASPPCLSQLPVVVVGGGLAGLAASIEASRAGAPVILMEKANRIGGNSAKATSGVWFVG